MMPPYPEAAIFYLRISEVVPRSLRRPDLMTDWWFVGRDQSIKFCLRRVSDIDRRMRFFSCPEAVVSDIVSVAFGYLSGRLLASG